MSEFSLLLRMRSDNIAFRKVSDNGSVSLSVSGSMKRITIDPKCKQLIRDCEIMTWKNGDLDQTTDKSITHAFDAASYPVYTKYAITKGSLTQIRRTG